MRRISILGIVLGGVAAIFSRIVLMVGMGVYAVMKVDVIHQSSQAHAQELVRQLVYKDPVLYFGGMAIAFACCIFGGWLSAFTAREAERLNGALSALLLAGMQGWHIFFRHEDPHSTLVQLFYIAVLFAGGWIGGWMRSAQKARAARPTLTTA